MPVPGKGATAAVLRPQLRKKKEREMRSGEEGKGKNLPDPFRRKFGLTFRKKKKNKDERREGPKLLRQKDLGPEGTTGERNAEADQRA